GVGGVEESPAFFAVNLHVEIARLIVVKESAIRFAADEHVVSARESISSAHFFEPGEIECVFETGILVKKRAKAEVFFSARANIIYEIRNGENFESRLGFVSGESG